MNGPKCRVWVLNKQLTRSCRDFELRTATFSNLRKSSEHLQESSAMFRSHRNIFGSLEVFGNFSEVQVIWIRKSHAFDLGKVGRYMVYMASHLNLVSLACREHEITKWVLSPMKHLTPLYLLIENSVCRKLGTKKESMSHCSWHTCAEYSTFLISSRSLKSLTL